MSPIGPIETGVGKFGFTWNNTFLPNYDVIVPTTDGTQMISREGTEAGQPVAGLPEMEVDRHPRLGCARASAQR